MEDIDSVHLNPVRSVALPKAAELLASAGKMSLYCVPGMLPFQVWQDGTYCAGFTDQARAEIYLKRG